MRPAPWILASVASLALSVVACGGAEDGGGMTGPIPPVPPLAEDGSLTLPPPERGLQLEMPAFPIAPGQERELCYAVTLPEGLSLDINAFQSQYRRGSHHFRLLVASEPIVEDGHIGGCGLGDETFGVGIDHLRYIYGTQRSAEDLKFPEGVVVKLAPGSQVVMDSHYINYGDEEIDGEVRVNLIDVDDEAVVEEADTFFWYNADIAIPPGETWDTQMSCRLTPGTNLVSLLSHTHQLGTATEVFSVLPDREDVRLLREENWAEPTAVVFGSYVVAEDEALRVRCEYHNNTEALVTGGETSKDEMCIISGYYFPRGADDGCTPIAR